MRGVRIVGVGMANLPARSRSSGRVARALPLTWVNAASSPGD